MARSFRVVLQRRLTLAARILQARPDVSGYRDPGRSTRVTAVSNRERRPVMTTMPPSPWFPALSFFMLPQQPVTVPELVERFDDAWRAGDVPPDIAGLLPDSPVQRPMALIELVKVDLRHRWAHGHAPKRLAQYCAEIPELASWPLPPDLIYEEFHVRREGGATPDADEYTEQYPDQAEQLSDMLATGE